MIIATIDFDIIMAPSIQLYNTLVPAQSWDKLIENPHFQLCMADTNIYEKIFKYIMKCVKYLDQSHIHFIDSHDKVLLYINEKSDIINIDHHHDIGYGNDPDKPDLTCADWVSYLYNKDKLNSYTWIRNINSELPEGKWDYIDYNEKIIQEYNIDELQVPDELIICLSEPWIPPYYIALFFTIMDFCNQYYNTHFEIEYGGYYVEETEK